MNFGNIAGLVNGTEQVVFDYEVAGSAVTSISTGNILNGDEDGWYTIIARLVPGSSSSTYTDLQFNSDTGANYGVRGITAVNTTVGDGASTGLTGIDISGWQMTTVNGFNCFWVGRVYAKSGAVRLVNYLYASQISGTTVTDLKAGGGVWNNTADNITNITVVASVANGLGVGTRIIILKSNNFTGGTPTGSITTPYIKGAWVRVGSQVLGATASSVTFSGLDGDRDALYYLSCGVKCNVNSTYYSAILSGDTGDNYGRQMLRGVNTTVAAVRNTNGAGYGLMLNETACDQNDYGIFTCLIFAKKGFIRPAIGTFAAAISGTTVDAVGVEGNSWNNTTTNITSIQVTADQANSMLAGTQIDLYALRPNG